VRVLYNEWDEPTAAWLRELIDGCHLPSGAVDTRSIGDVRANDLRDFDQCHFFAGIGGWPLALRWAGLEGTPGIWTGSPPCQPFSVAGKGLGQADERHLAPVWLDLIRECKPSLIFGEQVEAAIRVGWLDDLFDALEECGYACGAAVLPACSVGAPHIRKRLFFGAVRLADAYGRSAGNGDVQSGREHRLFPQSGSPLRQGREGPRAQSDGLANTDQRQCGRVADGQEREPERAQARRNESDGISQSGSVLYGLADAYSGLRDRTGTFRPCGWTEHSERGDADCLVRTSGADTGHDVWSSADWLGCRDGKFRPVEPGTQPLASRLPARVVRLRGYGNAIVPQVAAQFITEFLGANADMQDEGLTP